MLCHRRLERPEYGITDRVKCYISDNSNGQVTIIEAIPENRVASQVSNPTSPIQNHTWNYFSK